MKTNTVKQLRVSGYKDYIAIDLVNKKDKNIINTLFYISNNHSVEVHYSIPSSERVSSPCCYEDWYDICEYTMIRGEVFIRCINNRNIGCPDTPMKINVDDLIYDKFEYAKKITEQRKISNN